MTNPKQSITFHKIFIFWLPLASTWLMMSIEGPFLTAVIARLAEPKFNLAAYGIAFSFALVIESPIIMIMSASTALVKNKDSFIKLRNFTYVLNGIITFAMLVVIYPPVFHFISIDLIELPEKVANLTHIALIILLPWPGAIGYRRFYQGIFIRYNLTRRVAYGTFIRLTSMSTTALILYSFFDVKGIIVGAAALSVGVSVEAIASRIMVHNIIKRILSEETPDISEYRVPLTYKTITSFYYPLALTSILGLAVHPMITFFIGQSRFAIESLAVLPVINSLVFIFRSMGLSFQEVGIALMGDKFEQYIPLRNFALILGISVVAIFSLIAFTPIYNAWFLHISGLSSELSQFAKLPTQIMTFITGSSVLLSLQRSIMVNARKTAPVTWATIIEVISIIGILVITVKYLDLIGALAATLSLVLGRFASNLFLFRPYFIVLKGRNK